MGVETSSDLQTGVSKPRHDLYVKMAKEDSEAATDEEVAQEAVTKYR